MTLLQTRDARIRNACGMRDAFLTAFCGQDNPKSVVFTNETQAPELDTRLPDLLIFTVCGLLFRDGGSLAGSEIPPLRGMLSIPVPTWEINWPYGLNGQRQEGWRRVASCRIARIFEADQFEVAKNRATREWKKRFV